MRKEYITSHSKWQNNQFSKSCDTPNIDYR